MHYNNFSYVFFSNSRNENMQVITSTFAEYIMVEKIIDNCPYKQGSAGERTYITKYEMYRKSLNSK